MNTPEVIQRSIILTTKHTGMRFDQVAAELFDEFSRSRLQEWIKQGCLTLDGQVINKPKHKLGGFERMVLQAEITAHADDQPQAIPLEIAYQDKYLIIVNKPAGMVVHPAAGNPNGTLVNALLHFDSALSCLPRAGIVHRLDKDTSGLLLVARNDVVRLALIKRLKQRLIQRHYLALVWGNPSATGSVAAAIGRHPVDRLRMSVRPDSDSNAKSALTHFKVKARGQHCSLLSVKLDTGRTHQIRVHMMHAGYPLVGDTTYRQQRPQMTAAMLTELVDFQRQALHATRLQFSHPIDEHDLDVQMPPPNDFAGLLKRLELIDVE